MGAPQRKNKAEDKIVKLADKQKREARPASEPEAREKQLVNLAVDLAEKQLRDGTASSAVLTHYLKLATKREHLERQILEENAELIKAKATSIKQIKQSETEAKEAFEALKSYNSGSN